MTPFSGARSRATRVVRCAVCGFAALATGAALAQAAGPLRAIPAKAAEATVLGPLILSLTQRRNLEAARSASDRADGTTTREPLATDRLLDPSSGLPDALVVSGVVIRSGNRSTVWVNDRPLYGRSVEDPLRALAGQAGVLQPGSKDMLLQAKPGQVIDVPSGQAVDLLPPGAIRILPPKAGTGATTKKE